MDKRRILILLKRGIDEWERDKIVVVQLMIEYEMGVRRK